MSYPNEGRNHLFLYHAYALALGGWLRDHHGQITSLPNLAPSVLSTTGGYGSACEKHVNFSIPGNYDFGKGSHRFHLYVGHAFSEVRGTVEDDEKPYGQYVTTVRSILDDVRINDDLYVEHAEAILQSKHDNPGNEKPVPEPEVFVGDSQMFGVHVRGAKVQVKKRDNPDHVARYGELRKQVESIVAAKAGGATAAAPDNAWAASLCDWHDPEQAKKDGASQYAIDTAMQNQKAKRHFRYSIFDEVSVPRGVDGIKSSYKSSVDIDNFGRIFLGEVIASHGTKQVNMFRIDLGCDDCGGVGGSSGTTNGGPMP